MTWTPNNTDDRPCIAIGNPPFGYRGWLALVLNRAAEFCDYVGFILPMSFQSDGKGSPKNRVRGMTLVHSENFLVIYSLYQPEKNTSKYSLANLEKR